MTEQLLFQQQETAGTIAYTLDRARREVIGMTNDPVFHEACLTQDPKIDPYDDIASPAYWETFAGFATQKIKAEATEQGEMTLDLEAMRLLAETPRFLYTQVTLNESKVRLTKQEFDYTRDLVSYYNGLVRLFAKNHPETNEDDVKKGMLAMIQASIEDEDTLEKAEDSAFRTLRGARYELGCGQSLAYAKQYIEATTADRMEFGEATREMDLQGVDWDVSLQRSGQYKVRSLGIDAKSSDRKLLTTGRKDPTLPFTTVRPGKIMVHLPMTDRDFHGKFFVDDATAQRCGLVLVDIINKAI